ncbi:alpha/beta-hydrolase [Vararia minispora EC-137]|uniref:Alpha/beta-hydrolase n=1 Tax=Vararia minispora EC-137 TaxID=1314806 RepID=A0ACB8QEX7_9AGAM|nr:alpha/beta-hydrolase [Vararia minispora EC-137]
MLSPFLLLCVLPLSFAQESADPLVVSLTSGTFRGAPTANGTEQWLGIPFVQPPVGALRFMPPTPFTRPAPSVQNASAFSNACPQPPSSNLGAPVGEDCLHLNVWRPQGTPANASLPVLVWFHVGSAASEALFDPTRIIGRSVQNGKPIMFVSTNYRLNTFGFLASTAVPSKSLNLGMQDMRAALQFVQDNIAAFGGDPDKVTIWGQSAGGGAVETQVLFSNDLGLYRAAIMDSSSGPYKTSPVPRTYDEPGQSYHKLITALNCSPGPSSFACLQHMPFETLLNASNAILSSLLNQNMWEPTVGPRGTIIAELSSERIKSGNFSHVPLIGGSNLNDGSIFATSLLGRGLSGAAEEAAFDNFVFSVLIDTSRVTNRTLAALRGVYPANDSALGAPFNTGDSLFDRGSAFYGDNAYTAPRRRFMTKATTLQPTWGYLFAELLPGANKTTGVAHGSELQLLFGPVAPDSVELDFANMLLDFYLDFITDLDPGPAWAPFTSDTKQALWLQRGNTSMVPDDFWADRLNLLNSETVLEQFIR